MRDPGALLGRLKSRLLRRRAKAGVKPAAADLEQARREIARRDEEIARLRASLAGRYGTREGNVRPGNMVWIFGAGRTGSTWLADMIEEMSGQTVWFEPRVGNVFDPQSFQRFGGKHFILSDHYKDTWLKSIRSFVLEGAGARFAGMGFDDYLMIKEPSGSVGAQWIMEALPESRMVLLVRDPRDYAASWLDAHRKGGWQNERRKKDRRQEKTMADKNPKRFVRRQAEGYMRHIGNAKAAFDAHKGRKVMVRYEDLRADTLGTMRDMYAALGIEVDDEELVRSVEKHSWENIPQKQKGEGKFYRKASPGGWREDLTEEQARIVEEITAPLLNELYPDRTP